MVFFSIFFLLFFLKVSPDWRDCCSSFDVGMSAAIKGVPRAAASTRTMPKPSMRDGWIRSLDLRIS